MCLRKPPPPPPLLTTTEHREHVSFKMSTLCFSFARGLIENNGVACARYARTKNTRIVCKVAILPYKFKQWDLYWLQRDIAKCFVSRVCKPHYGAFLLNATSDNCNSELSLNQKREMRAAHVDKGDLSPFILIVIKQGESNKMHCVCIQKKGEKREEGKIPLAGESFSCPVNWNICGGTSNGKTHSTSIIKTGELVFHRRVIIVNKLWFRI